MKRLIASALLAATLLIATPAQARMPARFVGWRAHNCLDIGFNEDGTPIIVCR